MLELRVRSVTYEAEGILSFELVSPNGEPLPSFDAGAHINVRTPGGLMRPYSLCSTPESRDHYRIAVLHVKDSRGGSRDMHTRVQAGDILAVSEPSNLFPLDMSAQHTVLLAGGIGITPMLAMCDTLRSHAMSYELHYCTTTPERTAFTSRLSGDIEQGTAHIYHDYGDPARGLDIAGLLRERSAGTHVYFCGPPGFMQAVQRATSHWPDDAVHFECFGAPPREAVADAFEINRNGHALELHLARSDRTISIAPSQTILDALRGAGVHCETSCESGLCGACKLTYLSGRPGHGDYLLSESEQADSVLICCATVLEGPLVLDI